MVTFFATLLNTSKPTKRKSMNAVEIEAAVSELAAKPFDALEFAFDF